MFRRLTAALAYVSILCSASASILYSASTDEAWLYSRLSPDLQKFMVGHPTALTVLSNAFSQSFSNRSVAFFYFYSTNEVEAKAAHFYPAAAGVSEVFICVRENQHPLDQFISLLYETLNSRNERQFENLARDACNGSVSKDVFVNTILRLEFAADLDTRALLMPLHFSRKEIKQSRYYKLYKGKDFPMDFQGYLAFIKTVAPKQNAVKDYEDAYDELRKQNHNAESESEDAAKPEISTPASPAQPRANY